MTLTFCPTIAFTFLPFSVTLSFSCGPCIINSSSSEWMDEWMNGKKWWELERDAVLWLLDFLCSSNCPCPIHALAIESKCNCILPSNRMSSPLLSSQESTLLIKTNPIPRYEYDDTYFWQSSILGLTKRFIISKCTLECISKHVQTCCTYCCCRIRRGAAAGRGKDRECITGGCKEENGEGNGERDGNGARRNHCRVIVY